METKDIITFIGVILTLCVSLAALIVGLRNSQKTLFTNLITSHRINIIDSLRTNVTEFSILVLRLADNSWTEKEKGETYEKIERLRILIKIALNPTDKIDLEFIEKINLIANIAGDPSKNARLSEHLDELHGRTQDLIKLEWQGMKEEARKGDISKREKQELRKKILRKYPPINF